MSKPIEKVLDRLEGVKKYKSGFLARCPAHDDQNQSLSVSEDSEGKVGIKCFAGCETEDVLKAIGLEFKDLFPQKEKRKKGRGKIVAEYDYVDEGGARLFQVVRLDPKSFRQRVWDDTHKIWSWSLGGVRKVLWRLPRVKEAVAAGREVWVCEGEKDVMALERASLVATCNPMGAGKWEPGYTDSLRGGVIVIVRDKDKPGYNHAKKVYESLASAGCAVRIVEAAEGKDAFDHLAAGYKIDEFVPGSVTDKWIDPKAPERPAEGNVGETAGDSVSLAVVAGGAGAPPPTQEPPASVVWEQRPSREYQFTDLGNAYRLVDLFGQDLRFCHETGFWYHWNGNIWEKDRSGGASAQQCAIGVICSIWEQMSAAEWGSEKRGKLYKWAQECESKGRIEAMIALAKRLEGIPVLHEQLDADEYLTGCPNGTLDLREFRLIQPRREDLITMQLGVAYDPDAKCRDYMKWLATMLSGDRDTYEWLWRLKGYTLTGDDREEMFCFMHGPGGGGKGTVLSMMTKIMGDYGKSVMWDTLKEKKGDQIPVDIADLRGARFAFCDETAENGWFNEQLLKALSGRGVLKARFMRENLFQFDPKFKLWITGNHKPRIKSFDTAMERRLKLLPFEKAIPLDEQDKGLKQSLVDSDCAGVLAEMVRACQRWQEHGLVDSSAIRDAVAEYKMESDAIRRFIGECCEPDVYGEEPARNLYNAYKSYCRITEDFCGNETWFGRQLTTYTRDIIKDGFAKFKKIRKSSGYFYEGLTLKNQQREMAMEDPKYAG